MSVDELVKFCSSVSVFLKVIGSVIESYQISFYNLVCYSVG